MLLSLEDRALPCFFVTPAKVPFAGSHAYLDATADPAELEKLAARFRGPKLVAVATGAISGIDIIDIDPRHGGDRWYFEHIDQLGKTRVHETRGGGWHLIFRHSPSLRNSNNKLAHGVEFLSTGRWAVWWPEHAGRVLCPGPVAALPGWLHEALLTIPGDMATGKEVHPSTPTLKPGSDLLKATGSTLLRSKYLIRDLERCPEGNRHKLLHWTACRFGNMIGEGKIKVNVAELLLIGAAKANGLWHERPDNCLQTIRDGLCDGKEEWIAAGKRGDFLFSKTEQRAGELILDMPVDEIGEPEA
jgi:hypothetical protein